MDLDNPSYFSVATESPPPTSSFGFFKTTPRTSVSSSSDCSLSRQLTPPRQGKQRGIRGFLRSLSTNSADSNPELLVLGEPRLCDIAPDLKEPKRSNSLKNTKNELQGNDLMTMYCPLPTSEEDALAAEEEDEEIFINDDSARYYNLSSSDQRRHSIGTFMTRDRSTSFASARSFRDEVPSALIHATANGDSVKSVAASVTIDDHSLRHGSYPRKRCSRCTRGNPNRSAHMDDILIVSLKLSQAASLWVDYFTTYFQQISKQANRKPFKVQHIGAEDVTNSNGDFKLLAERTAGVKLQLVVLCPLLLDHIEQNPDASCGLGKLLLPDRTLALLLGVTDDSLSEVHKRVLPTYSQWQRFAVGQDQDENFTQEFLRHAMAIFSKIWKQQSPISALEKSQFSVSPKKIRQGQTTVLILLTHPLQKEDSVKVLIEKNDELVEIKSLKRRNPYTIKISIPDNLTEVSAIVNVLVEKNGSIIGSRPIKVESRLRELEQILRSSNNPMEFMCQTLGFSPAEKDNLDNWMVHSFQKNLPPHFNLLLNHGGHHGPIVFSHHKHSHEEFPTLLHFAARFGLTKLAVQLLDCPGGDIACDVRNASDLTPSEIAEKAGHSELAHILSGYMEMNEITSAYSQLKEMSLNLEIQKPEMDEDGYLSPNDNNAYKICPPPRPVNPLCSTNVISNGYLAMNNLTTKSANAPKNDEKTNAPSQLTLNITTHEIENTPSSTASTPTQTKHKEFCEDKYQRELMEILNDYKNNVHSIAEVERLVEEWKNRNDVQMSIKEKQEQLAQMKLKYEKIQQDMKNSMKKATPFERVLKLFSRGKSRSQKSSISSPVLNQQCSLLVVPGQRPISSLSLQSTSSSGSSGRMSTISGCSVGDSGTQSDPEDRKVLVHDQDTFANELKSAVMRLNYQTVPTPKPVKLSSFSLRSTTFETIEEKPVPSSNNDQHYIRYPPCGLPIPGAENMLIQENEYIQADGNEYMNFPGINQKPITHEYMNVCAVQKDVKPKT